ncbi:MAG: phosphoribosylformylglycinamidine synthase subunit PurS [Nitrospinales bacterium]
MMAKIHINFKKGVLDPQGNAVQNALNDLGYQEVQEVSLGKYFEIRLDGISKDEAEFRVKEMCEKLLANTVIESYRFELSPAN